VDEFIFTFIHAKNKNIFYNLSQKYEILIFYMQKCSLTNKKTGSIKLLNLFEYNGSCPNSIVYKLVLAIIAKIYIPR
jgi:hypothetical protein